jgi:foldase protein PrsA
MQFKGCCIGTLGAVVLSVGLLTACGSGGNSDAPVAQVAGVGTITKAMLEHWMPIEARILYSEAPSRPTPSGVVPDPPTYTACVAYLRVTPQKADERPGKQTTAQLRTRCAHKEQELKELTLNTLIGWDWTIGRGLRVGVEVTNQEAKRRVEVLKESDFAGQDFSKYLKYSGQTTSDILLRAKVQVIEDKLGALQKELLHGQQGKPSASQERAMVSLAAKLLTDKQWAGRTICPSGYVTSGCREYKGSKAPGVPN